jgi:hypothetical protein
MRRNASPEQSDAEHVPLAPNSTAIVANTKQDKDEPIYTVGPRTPRLCWDFWRAEQDSDGNWSACWGGKIFTDPLGAAAPGLPSGAFLIAIEELRRGHAHGGAPRIGRYHGCLRRVP